MSERKSKRNFRPLGPTSVAFVAVLVALVLYILSPGPVALLAMHGYVADEHFMIAYAPLNWLYENIEIVKRFYDWYMELWLEWAP